MFDQLSGVQFTWILTLACLGITLVLLGFVIVVTTAIQAFAAVRKARWEAFGKNVRMKEIEP